MILTGSQKPSAHGAAAAALVRRLQVISMRACASVRRLVGFHEHAAESWRGWHVAARSEPGSGWSAPSPRQPERHQGATSARSTPELSPKILVGPGCGMCAHDALPSLPFSFWRVSGSGMNKVSFVGGCCSRAYLLSTNLNCADSWRGVRISSSTHMGYPEYPHRVL